MREHDVGAEITGDGLELLLDVGELRGEKTITKSVDAYRSRRR
jgi:hypothetical protein